MPDPQAAWRFLEQSDLIAGADEIQHALRRIAAEVTAALAAAYPLVLVVMGGAVVFAGQILPLLRFPLDLDYIHASRYGVETRGSKIDWRVPPPAAGGWRRSATGCSNSARRAFSRRCWWRNASRSPSRSRPTLSA